MREVDIVVLGDVRSANDGLKDIRDLEYVDRPVFGSAKNLETSQPEPSLSEQFMGALSHVMRGLFRLGEPSGADKSAAAGTSDHVAEREVVG